MEGRSWKKYEMNLSPYKFVLLEKIQRVRDALIPEIYFEMFRVLYILDSQKCISIFFFIEKPKDWYFYRDWFLFDREINNY